MVLGGSVRSLWAAVRGADRDYSTATGGASTGDHAPRLEGALLYQQDERRRAEPRQQGQRNCGWLAEHPCHHEDDQPKERGGAGFDQADQDLGYQVAQRLALVDLKRASA